MPFPRTVPIMIASLISGLLPLTPLRAQETTGVQTENAAIHAQATLVVQGVPGFASPYKGANSLAPRQIRETFDFTVYAGVRPWEGGELWANPEIDQGFGLSNTLGVAGFPSAEAYKVGKSAPYLRLQRLFFRQTFALGGTRSTQSGSANQLAGVQTSDRIVLTLGKFGVGDIFDTNRYAHDPRGDFLNWALVDTGSFDYAADAWGYSYGAAAEVWHGPWTVRAGAFNLSKVPNGEVLERDFRQNQFVGEIEHRHTLGGYAGAVRITAFRNSGFFSRFDDALALAQATGKPVNAALTRRRMSRTGVAVNAEQEVTGSFGLFLRAGLTNGEIEPYDFTDIDRTVAAGGALQGKAWGRSQDTLSIAAIVNGISDAHKRYLAAGGIGVLVGDGQLPHPGDEQILEAYYAWRPLPVLSITADYQHVVHPGYNRDRGPANIFAMRLHSAF